MWWEQSLQNLTFGTILTQNQQKMPQEKHETAFFFRVIPAEVFALPCAFVYLLFAKPTLDGATNIFRMDA